MTSKPNEPKDADIDSFLLKEYDWLRKDVDHWYSEIRHLDTWGIAGAFAAMAFTLKADVHGLDRALAGSAPTLIVLLLGLRAYAVSKNFKKTANYAKLIEKYFFSTRRTAPVIVSARNGETAHGWHNSIWKDNDKPSTSELSATAVHTAMWCVLLAVMVVFAIIEWIRFCQGCGD
jgi:hypothetical protein